MQRCHSLCFLFNSLRGASFLIQDNPVACTLYAFLSNVFRLLSLLYIYSGGRTYPLAVEFAHTLWQLLSVWCWITFSHHTTQPRTVLLLNIFQLRREWNFKCGMHRIYVFLYPILLFCCFFGFTGVKYYYLDSGCLSSLNYIYILYIEGAYPFWCSMLMCVALHFIWLSFKNKSSFCIWVTLFIKPVDFNNGHGMNLNVYTFHFRWFIKNTFYEFNILYGRNLNLYISFFRKYFYIQKETL